MQPHENIFQQTAKLAGLTSSEWSDLARLLPSWPDHYTLFRQLLQRSSLTPTILLCLGDHVLLQYEAVLNFAWSPLHTRHSGERIPGKNEIVDPSAHLSTDVLRSIFVILEALVYKCVHIKLEAQSPSYGDRADGYEKRLNLLVREKLITAADERLGQELYETRCQFAHSLAAVDQITYLSQPLRDRWGSSGTTRARKLKRYFLADAFCYSETLLGVFKPVQAQQIDGATFKSGLLAALSQ